MRKFKGNTVRDDDDMKYDYEGFYNPAVENSFARYMHKHRACPDGTYRDSDNWQGGFGFNVCMKSLIRHAWDAWMIHRGYIVKDERGEIVDMEDALNGIKFNVNAYINEMLIFEGKKVINRGVDNSLPKQK